MRTHSMEFDSFYWAGIYRQPCMPLDDATMKAHPLNITNKTKNWVILNQ